MTSVCENFEADAIARAKTQYGVLVFMEIDGQFAVDEDLGKRYLRVSFTDTGEMKRAKQLRRLIKTWIEEDKLMEQLRETTKPTF